MIATALRPLSEAKPPLPNRVIRVSREEPLDAKLSDGTEVLVTWIGERTAVCVMTGNPGDVYHPPALALKNRDQILLDPESLPWVTEGSRFMKGRPRAIRSPRVHVCAGCRRSAGMTRFASPDADYCLECEEAGEA